LSEDRYSDNWNFLIEKNIEEEFIMDPVFVENQYYGKGGSIYVNVLNSKYAVDFFEEFGD
jgi:uncharacterized protein with NRDE domain